MRVKIKLFATLRNYGPDEQEVELPANATLEDAIKLLSLPEKIPLLKIVNGEHRPGKHPLKEGDEIALFPPIAGGQEEESSGSFLLYGDRKEYPVMLGQQVAILCCGSVEGLAVEEDLPASLPKIP